MLIRQLHASKQQLQILQSFSLLLLGAVLSTLATLNFSLAFMVGILAAPLSFVRPLPPKSDTQPEYLINLAIGAVATVLFSVTSPPTLLYAVGAYWDKPIAWLLLEMAKGWSAQGVYTAFVVWAVWWPAWVLGGVVLYSGLYRGQ